ncbi:basic amino acid ABC transporter substrate-binding protein [Desulfobotulus sp.]|jgi:polar amino acid transport system substrate-binding protein|uniref:basic amino acid ABC transporter substrate-binding protein n=1 Tax=Desulfobotulus sp. TaxID=1940337 RepID=UPI002A358B20|nr:basic amino acid ABC transporter substrate-binding protein [Desulfobotulus sp.]MDY0162412.1 basic amino acid ABC transporter substrate-binding protein [Desulfobotulus sp.]
MARHALKIVVLALMALAWTSMAMAECRTWQQIQAAGFFTVGTSPDYPPFESIDDKGNIVGFDIDLIRAMAAEMGLEVRFQGMGFDSILIAVRSGQVHLGMSSFSVTEERKQSVDFTRPYYKSGQVVIVNPDSGIRTVADLKGKVVSAQIGSTSADAAQAIEGATARIVDDASTAVMMLRNKAAQGAVLDVAIAENYVEKFGFAQLDEPLNYEEVAAVVRKGCPEFLDALNAALEKVEASGKLEELRKKWGV